MRQIPNLEQALEGAKNLPEVIRNQIAILNLKSKSPDIKIFTRKLQSYYSYITDKSLLNIQRKFFEGFYSEIDKNYPEFLFRLEGRRKSFISAYKKLWISDSYATMKDISGFRITLFGDDSEELIKQCYTVMELLFNYSLGLKMEVEPCMATPLKDIDSFNPDKHPEIIVPKKSLLPEDIQPYVKDYILNPKGNGYQSLHMTFRTRIDFYFEVQIRTFDMHMIAENGHASHNKYKEEKYDATSFSFDREAVKIPGYYIQDGQLYDWIGLENHLEIFRRQKTY